MQLLINLQNAIHKHKKEMPFNKRHFYPYSDFAETISKIRTSIQLNSSETEKNIGLVVNDDLETYAAIIALWFEGRLMCL